MGENCWAHRGNFGQRARAPPRIPSRGQGKRARLTCSCCAAAPARPLLRWIPNASEARGLARVRAEWQPRNRCVRGAERFGGSGHGSVFPSCGQGAEEAPGRRDGACADTARAPPRTCLQARKEARAECAHATSRVGAGSSGGQRGGVVSGLRDEEGRLVMHPEERHRFQRWKARRDASAWMVVLANRASRSRTHRVARAR